ncbi:MAG: four helix bundle protein [Candidatus Firestonebacteria bacterium]
MNMYRNLVVWKESISLIKEVYKAVELLPRSEEYNLKQQLKRSAVSVALNIAEGKNRRTAKDFSSFLVTANASLSEVDAAFAICEELNYLEVSKELKDRIDLLGRRISSLRNSLTGS